MSPIRHRVTSGLLIACSVLLPASVVAAAEKADRQTDKPASNVAEGVAEKAAAGTKQESAQSADGAGERECKRDAYPTAAIADYVLACMAANGNTFESLHQCSCSIDYVSERISYQDYERVQTVMQVQLDQGQRGIFYRDSQWAKDRVDRLQRVQAESTLECFQGP